MSLYRREPQNGKQKNESPLKQKFDDGPDYDSKHVPFPSHKKEATQPLEEEKVHPKKLQETLKTPAQQFVFKNPKEKNNEV